MTTPPNHDHPIEGSIEPPTNPTEPVELDNETGAARLQTAGEHLQKKLSETGIPSQQDRHEPSDTTYVCVSLPGDAGELRITDATGSIHHAPDEHTGWSMKHLPNPGDTSDSTHLYQSICEDFTKEAAFEEDTDRVLQAARYVWADPDSCCRDGGSYVTAGAHLRRALRAAGIDAHIHQDDRATHVRVDAPEGGVILIDDGASAIDHDPDHHLHWHARYYTTLGDETPKYVLHQVHSTAEFLYDTHFVVDTVTHFVTAAVTEIPPLTYAAGDTVMMRLPNTEAIERLGLAGQTRRVRITATHAHIELEGGDEAAVDHEETRLRPVDGKRDLWHAPE